jgi:hypothetical protein
MLWAYVSHFVGKRFAPLGRTFLEGQMEGCRR